MEFLTRLKELSNLGEVTAGSKKEKVVAEKISSYFDADERHTIPIHVWHWDQKHLELVCESHRVKEPLAMPYSPPSDLETRIGSTYGELVKIRLENLYDLNSTYLEHVKRGTEALIFTIDHNLRKFVVKYGDLLVKRPSHPPPIPVVYVKEDEFQKIEGRCRLLLEVDFNPNSTGYTVEAVRPGRSEEKVFITVHHDHWFSGEHDNLIGVSLLPEFRSHYYELHLVSFSAEESGAPGFPTFSWSYGSRDFVNSLNQENVELSINIDSLFPNSLTIYSTHRISGIEGTKVIYEPMIYSDGYSFVKAGIPNITFTSAPDPRYHSDSDVVQESEGPFYLRLMELVNRLLSSKIELNSSPIRDNLLKSHDYLSPELRSYSVNLVDRLNEKSVQRFILKLYGGVLAGRYAEVKLFHVFYALKLALDQREVHVEDHKALRFIGGDRRFYINFLNQLKRDETEVLLSEIYSNLKQIL